MTLQGSGNHNGAGNVNGSLLTSSFAFAMIHRSSAGIRFFRIVALAAACSLAGCDLGTYEARRTKARTSVSNAWQAQKYLGQAATITNAEKQSTGVSINFPKAFGEPMQLQAVPPTYPISKALLLFAKRRKTPAEDLSRSSARSPRRRLWKTW